MRPRTRAISVGRQSDSGMARTLAPPVHGPLDHGEVAARAPARPLAAPRGRSARPARRRRGASRSPCRTRTRRARRRRRRGRARRVSATQRGLARAGRAAGLGDHPRAVRARAPRAPRVARSTSRSSASPSAGVAPVVAVDRQPVDGAGPGNRFSQRRRAVVGGDRVPDPDGVAGARAAEARAHVPPRGGVIAGALPLTPVDHGSQSPFISGAKRSISGRPYARGLTRPAVDQRVVLAGGDARQRVCGLVGAAALGVPRFPRDERRRRRAR